jgi:hypothetical protein
MPFAVLTDRPGPRGRVLGIAGVYPGDDRERALADCHEHFALTPGLGRVVELRPVSPDQAEALRDLLRGVGEN